MPQLLRIVLTVGISCLAGGLFWMVSEPRQPPPLVWFEVVADDGVILGDLLAQSDMPPERLAAAWVERYGVKGQFQVLLKPR